MPASMDNLMRTDLTLVKQAASEADAFGELYQRYNARVYTYHLARTGNIHDAQDLTSQTFIAALKNIGSYNARGSFPAWLMGIARHKLVDHYRSRKPLDSLDQAEQVAGSDPSPEDCLDQNTQLQRIHLALDTLPPQRAEALSLRFFAGLKSIEIASILGISESAVKMLVYRALQDVRLHLAVELEEKV